MIGTIPFTKVTVVVRPNHTDVIFFETTLPTCFNSGKTAMKAEFSHGRGVDWVRNSFGIEPEVIEG